MIHTKKPIAILLSIIILISLFIGAGTGNLRHAYAANPDYVSNGGAESGATAPNDWQSWSNGSAVFTWDDNVKRTGSKSLKIAQTGANASLWYQDISSVVAGQSYALSAWVKTDNVVKSGDLNAALNVDFRDASGDLIASKTSVSAYGTLDWTQLKLRFTVPAGTKFIRIGGILWGTPGTVWFDDISLEDEISVINGNMESGSKMPSHYSTSSNVGATFAWDAAEFHSGYRSAKITQSARGNSAFEQTLNGWQVGKTYLVDGWVKTTNVSQHGNGDASIRIEMRDALGSVIAQAAGRELAGTMDWTRTNFKFTVPTGTETVSLKLVLWDTTGTAWFDNLLCTEQVDYVSNGNMEQGSAGTVSHYTPWTNAANGDAELVWDGNTYHNPFERQTNGVKALRISHAAAADSKWWQLLDGFENGKKYRLSGWIKTSNISSGSAGEGASLAVVLADAAGEVLETVQTPSLFGENDWKYVSLSLTVPDQAHTAKVELRLSNQTGDAWFDDLAIMQLPDVEIAEPQPKGKWWDYWPRFTYSGGRDLHKVLDLEANVTTVTSFAMDEGRGPFFRESEFARFGGYLEAMEADGVRSGVWLEHSGESRAVLGAVNNMGGGNYEIDPVTGAPKLIGHNWTWDEMGPSVNPNANELVWMGLHSWANQEPWQGAYVRPNSFPMPTYPDGTPAIGYLDNSIDPTKAKLYDAMSSKDLNGNPVLESIMFEVGNDLTGKVAIPQPNGSTKYYGDIFFGRDIATDWWTKYNIEAAKYFMERGVQSFWVDNYSGFEFIGNVPLYSSFGYWTEAKFREYLEARPGTVPDPNTFDIKAYLVHQFNSWYPALDPYKITDGTVLAAWRDTRWQQDTVWRAFMSFKAETAQARAQELYVGIKQEAAALDLDPDDILIGGNDIPRLSFAALTGTEVDMINSEYNPYHSVVSGFAADGLPPYGHAGPTYSLAVNFAKSKRANIWYYLPETYAKYQNRTQLGEILGYEALSKNVLINTSSDNSTIAGSDESSKRVNRYIKSVSDIFGARRSVGNIGLVYSSQTELFNLLPGGYLDGGQNSNVGEFDGWGTALEHLNVPYRAIPDFKLSAAELADIEVLILPHVRVISSELVNDVLIPFANSGKTILVSGADSGSVKPWSESLADQASALLYDLVGAGKAKFVNGTPGTDFYAVHQKPGIARTSKLNALNAIIEGLIADGKLERQLEFYDFNEFVRTSLNYDEETNHFFVDIRNQNYDVARDILTPEDGGTLRIRLPESLRDRTLQVAFYDTDQTGKAQMLEYAAVDNATIDVDIPGFRVFGSIVISGGAKILPNLVRNPSFEMDGGYTHTPMYWLTSGANSDANYTQPGGHTGEYELVHWSEKNYNVYTYQTITGLVNGTYSVKAWVKNPHGGLGTAYMEAKDFGGTAKRYNIPQSGSWTQIHIDDIPVTSGELTVGFYSDSPAHQWYVVDDVEVFCVLPLEESEPLTYSIAAIADQTLTELTTGYAAGTQESKTITITRTGTGDLSNLRVTAVGTGFSLTQPAAALDRDQPSTAFELRAKDGLPAGTYTTTVTVSADQMPDVTFKVTQVVKAASSGHSGSSLPPVQYETTDGKLNLPAGTFGSTSLDGTIVVTIPAGATDRELRLTVEKIADNWQYATAGTVLLSEVYEILKNYSGNFVKPVTISFKFDPGKLKNGQIPVIAYYDEQQKAWVELGGTIEGDIISVQVNHLTKFAVLVKGNADVVVQPLVALTDIAKHWAKAAIERGVQAGIVNGYPDGSFKPDQSITRAEFAVMLMNTLVQSGSAGNLAAKTPAFTDWDRVGVWARAAVAEAVHSGILNGYSDGSFRPDARISRAEMAVMVARAMPASLEGTSVTPGFADDRNIPAWAQAAAAELRTRGIISGRTGNLFEPNATATRAEAITIILNLLDSKTAS